MKPDWWTASLQVWSRLSLSTHTKSRGALVFRCQRLHKCNDLHLTCHQASSPRFSQNSVLICRSPSWKSLNLLFVFVSAGWWDEHESMKYRQAWMCASYCLLNVCIECFFVLWLWISAKRDPEMKYGGPESSTNGQYSETFPVFDAVCWALRATVNKCFREWIRRGVWTVSSDDAFFYR